jgi:hypothetical protein
MVVVMVCSREILWIESEVMGKYIDDRMMGARRGIYIKYLEDPVAAGIDDGSGGVRDKDPCLRRYSRRVPSIAQLRLAETQHPQTT